MRGGQALADVHPEQGVLPQGDVELEELRLAEVEQRPPEHSGGDLLADPPAHLHTARVDAGVTARPRTYRGGG